MCRGVVKENNCFSILLPVFVHLSFYLFPMSVILGMCMSSTDSDTSVKKVLKLYPDKKTEK